MKKKFKFVWTVDECKKSMEKYKVTKALELLDDYPDVIIIDDNPEIKERYPKQTICIKPYDESLLQVLKKLKDKERLSASSLFSLSAEKES